MGKLRLTVFFRDALGFPTICLYEVLKRMLQPINENATIEAVVMMRHGLVLELPQRTALEAGRLSHKHKLPMANSMILATVLEHEAILIDLGFQVREHKRRAIDIFDGGCEKESGGTIRKKFEPFTQIN